MMNKALLSRAYWLQDVSDLEAEPSWLLVLADVVRADEGLGDDTTLDLHTALTELSACLSHPRPVENQHKRDWESLASDVHEALAQLGERGRARLPELPSLIAQLDDLVASAKELDQRRSLAEVVEDMLANLATRTALTALWADFVEAARMGLATALLHWHRRTLCSVLHALGEDTEDIVRELRSILLNRRLSVEMARVRTGSAGWDDEVWSDPNASAGLGIEERLSLCQGVLEAAPERGDAIVWLLFDHAKMSSVVLDIGPIRFLDARWVLERIDTDPIDLPIAPELQDGHNGRGFSHLDRSAVGVFARVELPNCSVASAAKIARANAEALVELADFHQPGSTWTPRRGHVLFVNGQERAVHSFSERRPDWQLDRDGTENQLVRLREKVARRLPLKNDDLRAATQAIAELRRAVSLPHLDQIPLLVRLLDVARTMVGFGEREWYRFADARLRCRWVFRRIRHRTFSLGSHALDSPFHGGGPAAAELQSLVQLRERVQHGNEWDLRVLIDALPALANEYAGIGLQGEELREVAESLAAGEALTRTIEALDLEFSTLLHRSKRVRNAIVHGDAVVKATLPTPTRFLRLLCIDSFDLVLLALFDGIPIRDEYNQAAARDVALRSRAAAGHGPALALFGDEGGSDAYRT